MGDEQPIAIAPVLFLVFNRPDDTRLVFEAIRKAQPRHLYVAADGPRDGRTGEAAQCDEVRRIASEVDWDCEVQTLFRPVNLGCRRAVSEAITWFFEHEAEGIILEDDCLPDPTFFRFCSELLTRYRDDPAVAVVSGDCFRPLPTPPSSYVATRYPHVWGWASWRRMWRRYDTSISAWAGLRGTDWLLDRCDGSAPEAAHWRRIFDQMAAAEIDTWDYQLVFSCWLQDAVALGPTTNLVTNIGFHSAGTHTRDPGSDLANRPAMPMVFPMSHPPSLERDRDLEQWTDRHVLRPKRSLVRRGLGRLARTMRP